MTPTLTAEQKKRVHFLLPEQVFAAVTSLEARIPHAAPPTPDSKELLTAKEVKELLRIDVKTIYSYVERGLMPYVRISQTFVSSGRRYWLGLQSTARELSRLRRGNKKAHCGAAPD